MKAVHCCVVGTLLLALFCPPLQAAPQEVTRDEAARWIPWVIPMPREITLGRKVVVPPEQIALTLAPDAAPLEPPGGCGTGRGLGPEVREGGQPERSDARDPARHVWERGEGDGPHGARGGTIVHLAQRGSGLSHRAARRAARSPWSARNRRASIMRPKPSSSCFPRRSPSPATKRQSPFRWSKSPIGPTWRNGGCGEAVPTRTSSGWPSGR